MSKTKPWVYNPPHSVLVRTVVALERQLTEAKGELTDGMGKALEVELGLRADNCDLQARVAELEEALQHYARHSSRIRALAKVRGEALEAWRIPKTNHFFGCALFHKLEAHCDERCKQTRATIAMTPEEAKRNEPE